MEKKKKEKSKLEYQVVMLFNHQYYNQINQFVFSYFPKVKDFESLFSVNAVCWKERKIYNLKDFVIRI